VTVIRGLVLTAVFAALALVVVYLRAEQTRASARALSCESRWVESRRELWALQTQVSRLSAPQRIHDTIERFGAEILSPGNGEIVFPPARLVAGRELD
jgi:cell division protein FtsL